VPGKPRPGQAGVSATDNEPTRTENLQALAPPVGAKPLRPAANGTIGKTKKLVKCITAGISHFQENSLKGKNRAAPVFRLTGRKNILIELLSRIIYEDGIKTSLPAAQFSLIYTPGTPV
jgi:hypothetical protein